MNILIHRLTVFALIPMFFIIALSSSSFTQAQTLKQMLLSPGDLASAHKKEAAHCEKCHRDFSKAEQSSLCLDCHDTIASDVKSRSGFHGLNPNIKNTECKVCHTDHKGAQYDIVNLDTDSFNHQQTNFPLNGTHGTTACVLCHKSNKGQGYRLEQSSCFSCHEVQDEHNNKLGKQCDDCHTEDNWTQQKFDHEKTEFSLVLKHKDVPCERCHINQQYTEIGKQCNDCHRIHDTHLGRFGGDCKSCHSEKGWEHSQFSHNKDTQFELLFSHKQANCLACHITPVSKEKELADDCVSCHESSDIHNGRNGEDCQHCHTPKSWSKSAFDHDTDTKYTLSGRHKHVACNACHNPIKRDESLSQQCVDCHQLSDPHQQSLGKSCDNCHSTAAWNKTLFSHDITKFPLLGMHRQLSCEECHLTAQYEKTSSDCRQCHQQEDSHKGALGDDCKQCHNPNDWAMWLFDHNKQTHFALEGAHADLQCKLCHNTKHTPQTCFDCHRDDDVHRGSFGKRCRQCHQLDSFNLEHGAVDQGKR